MFKFNLFRANQSHILSRCSCKVNESFAASSREKSLMWSAKSRFSQSVMSTISLTYNRNSNAPRLDPCGTPEVAMSELKT